MFHFCVGSKAFSESFKDRTVFSVFEAVILFVYFDSSPNCCLDVLVFEAIVLMCFYLILCHVVLQYCEGSELLSTLFLVYSFGHSWVLL